MADHRVLDLHCTKDNMTATWETGVFMPKSSLSISLLDPSCNVYVQNKTHTSITTPHTKCGTVFTEEGDVITMSNVVKVFSLMGRLHGSNRTKFNRTETKSFTHLASRFVIYKKVAREVSIQVTYIFRLLRRYGPAISSPTNFFLLL